MAVMRGAGRGARVEGMGTLGLGSMVALEGEAVIMVLDTTLLMCMLHAFPVHHHAVTGEESSRKGATEP
jgi:hypothetical protein